MYLQLEEAGLIIGTDEWYEVQERKKALPPTTVTEPKQHL